MNKLILIAAAVSVMAAGVGVAMHVIGNHGDPISEANVEALARGEGSKIVTCEAPWDPECTTLGNL